MDIVNVLLLLAAVVAVLWGVLWVCNIVATTITLFKGGSINEPSLRRLHLFTDRVAPVGVVAIGTLVTNVFWGGEYAIGFAVVYATLAAVFSFLSPRRLIYVDRMSTVQSVREEVNAAGNCRIRFHFVGEGIAPEVRAFVEEKKRAA